MRIGTYIRSACCSVVAAGIVAAGAIGCSSTSETAQRDTLTQNVGIYPPAPAGIAKPRVGVPQFVVKGSGTMAGGNLDALAADQMTTLLFAADRFDIIERAQLDKLLDEQNLEGIVASGELAKTAQIRGVDYLLLGKVTNLRVKSENLDRSLGVGQLGGFINLGGFDMKKKDIRIHTECGVDIRLVDPTTGQVVMANFSEYKKTDSAGAIGVDILGASAEADAQIQIDEDDKGKILRLALDDALKKSLPKLDQFLVKRSASQAPSAVVPGSNAPAVPAANPAVTKKFCGECGKEVAAGAKFCSGCGAKVE